MGKVDLSGQVSNEPVRCLLEHMVVSRDRKAKALSEVQELEV